MKSNKDFGGAIFFIFIGTVFLLNTTNIVGWGIWEHILSFWPVLLILAGLKMIFKESLWSQIIIGFIAFLFYSIIGIFSYISYTNQDIPFLPEMINRHVRNEVHIFVPEEESTSSVEFTIADSEYADIQKRNMDFEIATSEFTIKEDSTSTDFLKLESRYLGNYIEPKLSSEKIGDDINITYRTDFKGSRIGIWPHSTPELDFTIGQTDLATDIAVDLGAGEGTIELSRLNIKNIEAKVGAGSMVLELNDLSIPQTITLDIGAGDIDLRIPQNIGYTLDYDLGVGEIKENNNSIASFIGENSSYKSVNYDTAEIKITITAKVGVGTLNIYNQ